MENRRHNIVSGPQTALSEGARDSADPDTGQILTPKAPLEGSPFPPTYQCAVCNRDICGVHDMTISHEWRGWGRVPPSAVAHLCSKKCSYSYRGVSA